MRIYIDGNGSPKWRSIRRLAACLLLACTSALAQTAPQKQAAAATIASASAQASPVLPIPVPRTVLYRYFFDLQIHLDQEASQREKNGKDGAWLRNHFQQLLGFTDAEFQAIRETGARIDSQMKVIDSQVKTFVKADWAQNPPSTANSAVRRPVPPQIVAFTKERDSIIENEVARLKESLTPEHAAKLESFVTTEFVKPSVVQHSGQRSLQTHPHKFNVEEAHP